MLTLAGLMAFIFIYFQAQPTDPVYMQNIKACFDAHNEEPKHFSHSGQWSLNLFIVGSFTFGCGAYVGLTYKHSRSDVEQLVLTHSRHCRKLKLAAAASVAVIPATVSLIGYYSEMPAPLQLVLGSGLGFFLMGVGLFGGF
mmetsp:Transcript_17133/g.26489  ORF Transcript_17133/g.26489 Transcript_17133/m.26489 type:complete len:141 (+) Transcript_17133:824-1246(+)